MHSTRVPIATQEKPWQLTSKLDPLKGVLDKLNSHMT